MSRASTYQHSESGTFVSPAVHRQYWIIEAPDGRVYTTTRTHGITPETENSTHVFMQSSRNYALDDDRVSEVSQTAEIDAPGSGRIELLQH